MIYEKWRLVGGNVYRLADVFDNGRDAVLLARTLKNDNCVVISKTPDGRWAVYWRARGKPSSAIPDICSPA
ncbi:MAG: hypothetical protein ACTSUB_06325 [Candidatus Thorarchaeota archaeon]